METKADEAVTFVGKIARGTKLAFKIPLCLSSVAKLNDENTSNHHDVRSIHITEQSGQWSVVLVFQLRRAALIEYTYIYNGQTTL